MCGSGGAGKPEEADPKTQTAEGRPQTVINENGPTELAGAVDRLGWQFHNAEGLTARRPSGQERGDSRVSAVLSVSSVLVLTV